MSHPCPAYAAKVVEHEDGTRETVITWTCPQTAGEWSICRTCASKLAKDLGDLPACADELNLTITRQSGGGARIGPRGSVKPLAFDEPAAATLAAMKAVLVGWVRDVAKEGEPYPADTAQACARWLLARVDVLRRHPCAEDIVREVAEVRADALRRVDRAPERWFAGDCDECSRPLYAIPNRAVVRCGCGLEYTTADRRAWLKDHAREQELTAPQIQRALPTVHERTVAGSTMRSWRRRGQLAARGLTLEGRETFLVGDVLDLMDGLDVGIVGPACDLCEHRTCQTIRTAIRRSG